ncbi:MarR family winged helix-turn-helix transcriptional regulator [Enterococcus sp. LJL98]
MNRQEKSLQALIAVLRTSGALEMIVRKDVSCYGLNLTEFSVLELLYHKGFQTTQTIKNKILIASSSTTYVVDQLEKKGYVQRLLCQEDKRVTYVEITDAGRVLMEEIFPIHAKKIATYFEKLTEEELVQLKELLKKVKE